MTLTPEERKMLDFLRRQHGGWKSVRTTTLVLAILMLAFCVVGIVVALLTERFWLLLLMPLSAGLAAFGLSYAMGSWHGRPEISLLLKLVDHLADPE